MGLGNLFKNLFSSSGPEPAEEAEEAPESESLSFPALNLDMPVDVMENYDTVLLTGRVSRFDHTELVVERMAGEMSLPTQQVGGTVLIRGYNEQIEPLIMQGIVKRSSLVECVVSGLELIPYDNLRKSVRYPLSPPANIYAMEDTTLDQPQECRLLNISTGGACIESTFAYAMNQTLRLRVELIKNGGYTSYQCQVVRITPRPDGHYMYGLLFAQLSRSKMNELMRDINTIQAETKRRVHA